MFKSLIIVLFDGGLGNGFRFLIGYFFSKTSTLPLAKFLAKILGCITTVVLLAYFKINIENERFNFFLVALFCGGLTTLSIFSLKNFNFFQNAQFKLLFSFNLLSIFAVFFSLMDDRIQNL